MHQRGDLRYVVFLFVGINQDLFSNSSAIFLFSFLNTLYTLYIINIILKPTKHILLWRVMRCNINMSNSLHGGLLQVERCYIIEGSVLRILRIGWYRQEIRILLGLWPLDDGELPEVVNDLLLLHGPVKSIDSLHFNVVKAKLALKLFRDLALRFFPVFLDLDIRLSHFVDLTLFINF